VACHAPAVRPAIGDKHAGRHRARVPVEVAGNPGCEPALAIERSKQLADVDYFGLELDHEQRPSRRMPGEEVHDSTLAVDRERDLGPKLPASRLELSDNGVAQLSMALAQEPVCLSATPSSAELQANLESGGHASQRAQWRTCKLPAFDP